MPPTRSPEFTACIEWIASNLAALEDGETVTIAELRALAAEDGVILGAADNYLLRGLRELVATGTARLVRFGTYAAPQPEPQPEPVQKTESPSTTPEAGSEPTDRVELHAETEGDPEPDPLDSLLMPSIDPTFQWSAGEPYIEDTRRRVDEGLATHLLAVGPAGSGKTEAGLQLAARLNLPAVVVECSLLREPSDLFGLRHYDGRRLTWRDSAFAAAVERGRCVVILDELNRSTSDALNALLPLLDRRGRARIEARGNTLAAGPGVVWWATANEGRQYVGASAVDRAVSDRFSRRLEFTYLPQETEERLLVERTGVDADAARRLVTLANATRRGDIRGFAISTRHLLAAAEDFRRIGPASLRTTLVSHFDPEGDTRSPRATFASLLVGLFPAAGDLEATIKAGDVAEDANR